MTPRGNSRSAGITNSIGSFDSNPGAFDATLTVHNNIIQNLERYGVLVDNVAARTPVTGNDVSFNKIASPMLTHIPLLKEVASEGKHTFISTGMSDFNQIDEAVQWKKLELVGRVADRVWGSG